MSEELKKASLLLRVTAKALDFIIIAAMAEVIPKAGFYAGLSYLLISDGLFDGRSLGKQLMGLRVISFTTSKACSMKESILRNAPLGIGLLFFMLPFIGWVFLVIFPSFEFLMLLGSKNGMRLGDEIAKTIVIEKTQIVTESAEQAEG